MKKYNTIANEMFKAKLLDGLSPTEITKLFIADYFEWNKYAYTENESEKPEKEWNIRKSYDNLIVKYCGFNKKYQGIAYGSNGELLSETKIIEEITQNNKSVVKTKYQNPKIEFIKSEYEYHFIRNAANSNWILEEKYFVDDDSKKHKYL